ncbi:unnamed protein product [Cuscuta campestris]|uniref:Uncharacterized protein n=1 Tax=Cuscuta campestris TaxID=132261 RepID=A0A484M672_9ASTE|nr:unnamed protein product [Cuscuta campestris]
MVAPRVGVDRFDRLALDSLPPPGQCPVRFSKHWLAGGSDTSAASVEWAFQELLRNPSVIERATEELDRVIGRERWVEEKHFPQLPYVEAIIRETFRLHPLGTLLPPHYSMEDCNVAVARGTTVLVNVWSIGRNPKVWERAEEFYPERF